MNIHELARRASRARHALKLGLFMDGKPGQLTFNETVELARKLVAAADALAAAQRG